eukprot:795393_1
MIRTMYHFILLLSLAVARSPGGRNRGRYQRDPDQPAQTSPPMPTTITAAEILEMLQGSITKQLNARDDAHIAWNNQQKECSPVWKACKENFNGELIECDEAGMFSDKCSFEMLYCIMREDCSNDAHYFLERGSFSDYTHPWCFAQAAGIPYEECFNYYNLLCGKLTSEKCSDYYGLLNEL